MIPVTCGILLKNNKILMSKRNEKKREWGGFWEFPGGKCNSNESIKNCIIREIKEELNIDIEFQEIIFKKMKFSNKYNLYYCLCHIINDNQIKKNCEISDYKYLNINEISYLRLLPGDYKIIDKIRPFLF